jgi:hypothetical protein
MIQQWLPTNSSHSLKHIGTARLCPNCQSTDKDQTQFLESNHDTLQQNWATTAAKVYTKLEKYNKEIHPQLLQLLTLSITQWQQKSHLNNHHFCCPNFTPYLHNKQQ